MKKLLPESLINLALSCPFPLYVVGGRVRDFLAELVCDAPDTDLSAPAPADEFATLAQKAGFKIDAVYKNTGTVKLSFGAENFEYACFRSDEYVRGTHRPVNTFFTDDITLDALRRDFKCNAVYFDIAKGEFTDPLGGIADIKNKLLSTVAASDKVFGEDGLRLMRLARISAETGFKATAECEEGARKNAGLIRDIAPERVWAELYKILCSDLRYGREYAAYNGLEVLKKTGVLKEILPELCLGDGMIQRPDVHRYDVLEHSLRTVMYADVKIRLAALLHDVGKPRCMLDNGNYYNHEGVGAEMIEGIAARLKIPKKLAARAAELTKLHMYDLRCDARENKVRRFIVKNYELFDELLLLKQADFSACRDDLSPAPCVVKMQRIFKKMQEEGVPCTLKHMNLRGNELIAAGCPENFAGEALNNLLLACAVGQVKNKKEKLIRYAIKNNFFLPASG